MPTKATNMIILRLTFLLIVFVFCSEFCAAQSWKAYVDSAKTYFDKKDTDSALIFYIKAREILSKDSALTDTYIKTNNSIAEIYKNTSETDSAISYYLETRSIIEKKYGNVNEKYGSNSNTLGEIYLNLGQYKNAELYLIEARGINAQFFGKESSEYAISCNILGALYSLTGQFGIAERLYLEALIIREKTPGTDTPEYAQSSNNLGDLYRNTGQFEKAEPLILLAKDIRERKLKKEHRQYAISCINLANLYRDIGQYEKAEQLYIEAKGVRERVFKKQSPIYATSCNILADFYVITGLYAKAEPLYLEALQIRKKKQNRDYAQSCNNLADMYNSMGLYEKAIPLAIEAKKIWTEQLEKHDPAIAINNNLLGNLYSAMGQYQKAENYFLEARPVLKSKFGREHSLYFTNSTGLARIYSNTDRIEKANKLYTVTFYAQYNQLNKVFQFTNENEKQLYLENVNGAGDEYQSFYYKTYRHSNAAQPYTISLLSRNLILSATRQQRQAIFQSGDSNLTVLYNKWIIIKQQLASMNVQLPLINAQSFETWKSEIKSLENIADSLEKKLVRSSAIMKRSKDNISWQKIKKCLSKSEAAIEFISFKYYDGERRTDSIFYAAIVLLKNNPLPQLVPLFEKQQLDSLLKGQTSLRFLSRGIKLVAANNNSFLLYNLVWQPLEKYLPGIKTIYFAAAGDLFKIPFAALPIDSTHFISDKYKIIQLNTTAFVKEKQQSFINSTDKLQLFGGILYDADSAALIKAVSMYHQKENNIRSLPADRIRGTGFEYLPGSAEEVNEVKISAEKAGMNVTLLSGINASEEAIKALSNKNSPAVMHIATHGFFFPDPTIAKKDTINEKTETDGFVFSQSKNPLFRSGLLFTGANNSLNGRSVKGIEDGILTAYEVSDMYLPNTKLVVLSACETALGDIEGSEGVYGLQRAFKMAGVQNIVMSLWEVPDKETSEFMQVFYKKLFDKQSVSDAFFNTQTFMKNKYRNEPYKWAAWILVR